MSNRPNKIKSASHIQLHAASLTISGKQGKHLEIYFIEDQRPGPQLGRKVRTEESGYFQGKLQKSTEFGNLLNGEYRRKSKAKLKFCVWVTVRMTMLLTLETQKRGQDWEG